MMKFLLFQRFENYKRVETDENPNGNFSYKGLRCLFEYLYDLHDEENPLKLDVISLCCDYSEYRNLDGYLKDYSNQHENKQDLNQIEEEINENTTLIKFGDNLDEGFIIGQY